MMRKILLSSYILCCTLMVLAQKPNEVAQQYIENHLEEWELEFSDISEMRLSDSYTSKHNGVTHLYFTQQYNGLDVHNAMINLNILETGDMAFSACRFVSNLKEKVRNEQALISAKDALLSAALHLEIEDVTIENPQEIINKNTYIFEGGAISKRPIKAELMYFPSDSGVQLVWALDIDVYDSPDYWAIKVDATTAQIIAQHNYTVYCTHEHHRAGICDNKKSTFLPGLFNQTDSAVYHVFPVPLESPIHGERAIVVNPADSTASPYGWHDTDGIPGAEFTITRGNNAHVYADTSNLNESIGDEPDGGENLIFDFPYQEFIEPDSFTDFATTQLFYMNNIMHDFAYAYGFDEAAGNFQQNNYDRGGSDGDYVIAHAQDGGGSNNANFGTPPDGGTPLMQMYLWSRTGLLTVTSPISLAGIYETRTADFGPRIIEDSLLVTGEVTIANDVGSASSLGCNEIQNDLTGKVALIDRGECFFSTKAYQAELAGAVAVIICNYEGGSFSGMSRGTDDVINIPSVMIQYSDCQRIRAFAGNQLSVVLTVPDDEGPSAIDGTLDNGIVAHEYGHGISNRLTGGASNTECLFNTEQMGEGWSDFFSLVTTVQPGDVGDKKRGVGVYAQQQGIDGAGIRRFPYSNSMDINPLTYADVVNSGVPHGLGEVWAATLWDLYWAMVDKYGWDENLYYGTGGNNMAVQLVMDGMKFQACSPGFIDGRNAILAADRALYDGANQCLIWDIFARRGLGVSANQRSNNNSNDGKADYESLPSCVETLKLTKRVTDEIQAGEDIIVTLTLRNDKANAVTGVTVTDIIAEGTSFVELLEGPGIATAANNMLQLTSESLETGESIEWKYRLSTSQDLYSTNIFFDDMELGDEYWEFLPIGIVPDSDNADVWQVDPTRGIDGSMAWFVPATERENDQGLQLLESVLVTGERPVLRFFHRYQTEWGNDGGMVRISTDGGNTWELVNDKMLKNGYETRLTYSTFAIPNLYGFTGEGLANGFQPTYVDLSSYLGQEILVQFRFGTDEDDAGFGWVVDNVAIMDMFNYNNEACAETQEGDTVCAIAKEEGTIVDAGVLTSTEEIMHKAFEVHVYPNPTDNYINLDVRMKAPEQISINIYRMDGVQVLQQQRNLQEGQNLFVVPLSSLMEGFYVLELRNKNNATYQKVVVEH